MSLVTPDFGLLLWMVLIFGAVFFILAKFGFPIITGMVEKRNRTIEKSLQDAREIEEKMTKMTEEHRQMIDQTRREQQAMLTEAADTRRKMVEEAKQQARDEAEKIVSAARVEIAAEKESALRDVRKEVALLSVAIAEKILRRELSDEKELNAYVSTLLDEDEAAKQNPPKE